jgi:hypothetical protein
VLVGALWGLIGRFMAVFGADCGKCGYLGAKWAKDWLK